MKVLISISFLLNVSLFSQANSNYYGYWLNENYYNSLINGITPIEAYKYNEPYIAIVISEEQNKIGFSKYLNEIGFFDFASTDSSIKFSDKINNVEYTVTLLNDDMILLKNGNGILQKFVRYPKKYQQSNKEFGHFFPNFLINDVFFCGDYVTLDSLKKGVSFSLNGEVTGIKGYEKYYVLANYLYGPDYNMLRLNNPQKRKESYFLAWEKVRDTLVLYSTIDTLGLNNKKGDVFLKLQKIKE